MDGFPEGLSYREDYLTKEQQAKLITEIDSLPWSNQLKRRVQHYGYKYDYTKRSIDPSMLAPPIPRMCGYLADKLVEDGVFPSRPDQLIVNEYVRGQGIAPHIDCTPCFRDVIVSVSLLSTYEMNFNWGEEKVNLDLSPGSLLSITGPARYVWRHGIVARGFDGDRPRSRRVSLTYRQVIINELQ